MPFELIYVLYSQGTLFCARNSSGTSSCQILTGDRFDFLVAT